MKANELMIGDWFQFKISKYPYKKGELINIKTHYEIALFDRLCGIPITSGILEKNGFERRDDFYEFRTKIEENESFFGIAEFEKSGKWFFGFSSFPNLIEKMKIDSVHELQHALRLCGLNDLADNFKL